MEQNGRAQIMWDFLLQTDDGYNNPDKPKMKALVTEVTIPNDSNINKKEHKSYIYVTPVINLVSGYHIKVKEY